MNITPRLLRFILNIYGPYLGAGVRVERIASNWREIDVSMKLRWYNRNAVGTHFGGSLYSMVDPHLMLMLMQILGKDYMVWDKSAVIDFIRPGKGKVFAKIMITDEHLKAIYEGLGKKSKFLPEFDVVITGEDGKPVARVKKTLYIRNKRT